MGFGPLTTKHRMRTWYFSLSVLSIYSRASTQIAIVHRVKISNRNTKYLKIHGPIHTRADKVIRNRLTNKI